MVTLSAKGGVIKSIGDIGAVMTNMALGTTGMGNRLPNGGSVNQPRPLGSSPKKTSAGVKKEEDALVMNTKLKIIEILEVSLILFIK